jgi:hypothetical protein
MLLLGILLSIYFFQARHLFIKKTPFGSPYFSYCCLLLLVYFPFKLLARHSNSKVGTKFNSLESFFFFLFFIPLPAHRIPKNCGLLICCSCSVLLHQNICSIYALVHIVYVYLYIKGDFSALHSLQLLSALCVFFFVFATQHFMWNFSTERRKNLRKIDNLNICCVYRE